MNLIKEIQEEQILLVLIPKSEYTKAVYAIMADLEKIGNKICYIGLNKPYNALLKDFQKYKINVEKFFFIDALTKSSKKASSIKNCLFVSSPYAFTELAISYLKAIKEKCDSMALDSISTLSIYGKGNSAIKLSHDLLTKSRSSNIKTILLALQEDKDLELIKQLYLFVDKIVEYN